MTEWQWKVIIALCKKVLEIIRYGTANVERYDKDIQLIEEAIERNEE